MTKKHGEGATRLTVKVVPGASREGVAEWLGPALKVRVAAPAERGRANAALERILAEVLRLPRDRIRVLAGSTSPRKVIEITGLSEAEVRRRLGGEVGAGSRRPPDPRAGVGSRPALVGPDQDSKR